MSAFKNFPRQFRLPWRSPERIQSEVDQEIDFHLAMRTEELVRAGMDPELAAAQAKREFGDVERVGEALRHADEGMEERRRRLGWMRDLWMDLRMPLRRMQQSPGFTAAVVVTFALGIGANATMFGIVDRLLLSPPAHVAQPDDVVRLTVRRTAPSTGIPGTTPVFSFPEYQLLADAGSFSEVAAVQAGEPFELTLGRGADALRLQADQVTGNLFGLLGVRPAIGRFFGPGEDTPGSEGVAVLAYSAWKRLYGGEPGVIGRTLDFGFGSYTIVGVAPKGFTGVDLAQVDVWLPLQTSGARMSPYCWDSPNCNWIRIVARLAPEVSARSAEAEATALYQKPLEYPPGQIPPERGGEVVAAPLIEARGPEPSGESRVAVWLFGISVVVLLIACANVANLLLARAIRQRREIGIRLALGSSRGRLLGQVLAESLLLSAFGGIAALVLSLWSGTFFGRFLLPDVAWIETGVEARTAGVVVVLAIVAGLAAGVIPALQARRGDVSTMLKSSARSTPPGISRTRSTLTVLQAALSVLLLVGAGLFARSLNRVNALDLGLDPGGVLVIGPEFEVDLTRERQLTFYTEAENRLRTVPGVIVASQDVSIPFWSSTSVNLRVPGLDSIPTLPAGPPIRHKVSPSYFRLMGMALRRGRGFDQEKQDGSAPVVVVNETMAEMLWSGKDAVGQCLMIGGYPRGGEESAVCSEVVGIVENARISSLLPEEVMQYYTPLETGEVGSSLLARVDGDEAAISARIQHTLHQLEPGLRYLQVRPLRELIDPQARSWNLGALMFTVFGLLALLVASLGLYSVLAFSVAQRTFELGVRSAIGARRGQLMALVLGDATRLLLMGIGFGTMVAWLAAPRMADLLYATSPRDPVVLITVAAVLLSVGLLAAWLPARRAIRVDPRIALRVE